MAHRADVKIEDIANYLGVPRRNFYYWCDGDKIPNEEHYQTLLRLKEGINSGEITKENVAVGAPSGSPPDHLWITPDHLKPKKRPHPRPHPLNFEQKAG